MANLFVLFDVGTVEVAGGITAGFVGEILLLGIAVLNFDLNEIVAVFEAEILETTGKVNGFWNRGVKSGRDACCFSRCPFNK